MSTVSVQSTGSQLAVIATEHTIATITVAGVYQFFVDVSVLTDGVTPDEMKICEYMKGGASGDTERLVKCWYLYGKQVESMFVSPPRMSAISIRYTITQITGVGRTFVWGVQQA